MPLTLCPEASNTYEQILAGNEPDSEQIGHLIQAIDDQVDNLEHFADEIKDLFFNVLAKMSEKLFDRSLILPESSLEKLLIKTNPVSNQVEIVEREALFALSLGIKPSEAGATSTSFFMRNREGKKIAIFKPDDMSTAGKNNPKIVGKCARFLYKNIFSFTGVRQKRQSIGECFSYKASQSFGHAIVSPTKLSYIELTEGKKQRGSFQILSESFVPISENAKEIDQKQFAIFALFDFITGQVDRHFDNWGRSDDGILAIDNGASPPIGYITYLEAIHQYYWRSRPEAEVVITDIIQELALKEKWEENIIHDFLQCSLALDLEEGQKEIEELIYTVVDTHTRPLSSEELQKLLPDTVEKKVGTRVLKTLQQALGIKERIQVIERICNLPSDADKKNYTLRKLASLHTKEDFDAFWKTINEE